MFVLVKYCYLCAAFRHPDLELNPGRRRMIKFLLFNAVIQLSFSCIGLCRTGTKLPQTCLCCQRLLVGSDVHCIAIRIVTLTLVFLLTRISAAVLIPLNSFFTELNCCLLVNCQ